MNSFVQIQEPIWNDKSIGIAINQHHKADDTITIDITYISKKSQKRFYPDTYKMTVAEIIAAHTRQEKKGQNIIFVVPILKLNYAAEKDH